MERYLTFEDGEWGCASLSESDVETLEEIHEQQHERAVKCGHWILYVSHPNIYQLLARRYWHYVVLIFAYATSSDEPIVIETVLVADFPALVSLLTILKSGDMEGGDAGNS